MYDWLTGDPIGISTFSFFRNVIYLIVIVHIMTRWIMPRLFNVLNKAYGVDAKEHIWPELVKGNVAMALYAGFRVLGVLFALGWIAAAFIK